MFILTQEKQSGLVWTGRPVSQRTWRSESSKLGSDMGTKCL